LGGGGGFHAALTVSSVDRRQAARRRGPSTVAVLDQAFGRNERLALGRYNPSFVAAWERLGSQLADWQRRYGLRDPAARCR
jgi:hypothetical protein